MTGVIDDATGAPVGAGWDVSLWAEPSPSEDATLAVGDTVPEAEVADTTTASDGSFSLALADPTSVQGFAGSDGIVNYLVRSEADGEVHQYAVSAPLASSSGSIAANATTKERAVAKKPTHVALRALSKPTGTRTALAETPDQGGAGCGSTSIVAKYSNRHAEVGEGYTSTGSSASFSYTAGASSTFGVGVSTSGASSGFSANGTSDVSSSSTQGFSSISGDDGVKWTTGFTVTKTKQICNDGVTTYTAYASSFDGGDYTESSTAFSTNDFCVPERAGDSWNQDFDNAYTFGGGLEVGAVIGINLTAKTGWNSHTKVDFKFSKAVQLCGRDATPGGDARRLKTIS